MFTESLIEWDPSFREVMSYKVYIRESFGFLMAHGCPVYKQLHLDTFHQGELAMNMKLLDLDDPQFVKMSSKNVGERYLRTNNSMLMIVLRGSVSIRRSHTLKTKLGDG